MWSLATFTEQILNGKLHFFVQWDATYVNKSFVVFKDNSPRMKTWATAQKYSNDYIFCRFYKFPKKHS